ncbi:MAG TPA: cupredoxin domain-containing protein [Kofleriaceae bacterium]|jgi:plastocyanin domain-containing protein|nr:cupredoxin domain-containing protein [Kofleriaceae bacterium]
MSIVLVIALVACKQEAKAPPGVPAPAAATTTAAANTNSVAANGTRRVSIEAGTEGYKPDRIPGKPGEKLLLVFTRTADPSCISELKTPDGKVVNLPKGTPVEVAVTVPQSGEVGFACGMDMFRGAIVAEKS